MIARIWHGITPISKADEYADHQNKTGIADCQSTEGNRGVSVLRRIDGEQVHFLVLSFWDSVESIKKFAGKDHEKARYYPDDVQCLLEFPENVDHYDVIVNAPTKES